MLETLYYKREFKSAAKSSKPGLPSKANMFFLYINSISLLPSLSKSFSINELTCLYYLYLIHIFHSLSLKLSPVFQIYFTSIVCIIEHKFV